MINIYGQGRIHLKEIVYAELRKTEPSTPIQMALEKLLHNEAQGVLLIWFVDSLNTKEHLSTRILQCWKY